MEIVKLKAGDNKLLKSAITLLNEVFEGATTVISDLHLSNTLTNPSFHIYVTTLHQNVVAVCTLYELPLCTSETSELFIYDFAVAAEHQRTGVGTSLINEVKKFAQQKNQVLFVSAHTADNHAVNFYRRVFDREEEVRNFEFIPIDREN